MDRWVTRNNSGNFSDMARAFNISDDLARLIVYRGIDTRDKIYKYFNMDITMLYAPELLDGVSEACDLIKKKIDEKKKIRIVGDYDVDGIMSTYILYSALKKIGAYVDYVIPDRIKDGYGININIINDAYKDGIDTILTCDNGIAAIDQIAHGKELGMTIIVTDHHDIVFEEKDGKKHTVLPDADIIINPHKPGDTYPFKEICGAVVAFKLIKKLYDNMLVEVKESNAFIEFAALATVCDVMPLKDENRAIVREGLKMLTRSNNIGIRKLIEKTKALRNTDSKLSVYHLGFVIGPCLNATGRLETATTAVELLCTNDEEKAQQLAQKLVDLNTRRKEMTDINMEKAFAMIDNSDLINDKVLVVYLSDCHESIAGIIAGRIRERYSKPAIVITDGEKTCKGSGRSIEPYNMFEEITRCKDYLVMFGGHPMAAGLSIKKENIEGFRKALNDKCALTSEDMVNKIVIDLVKNPCDVTYELIKELDYLEPCGTGNEKAVFAARSVEVLRAYVLGNERKILKLDLYCPHNEEALSYDNRISAVYFGNISEFDKIIFEKYGANAYEDMYKGRESGVKLNILYYPQINEYNGRSTIQIVIKGYAC